MNRSFGKSSFDVEKNGRAQVSQRLHRRLEWGNNLSFTAWVSD